jgi:hypothetical protein
MGEEGTLRFRKPTLIERYGHPIICKAIVHGSNKPTVNSPEVDTAASV